MEILSRRQLWSYIPHRCNKYIEFIDGRDFIFLISSISFAPVVFISAFIRNHFVFLNKAVGVSIFIHETVNKM
jgi:hypothetical protein